MKQGKTLLKCLLLGSAFFAFAANAQATTYIGLVQGLAGEDYYQTQFDEQAESFQKASGRMSSDIDMTSMLGEDATRENVLSWISTTAQKATSEDRALLYYIGHGSYDEMDYRFNLPGPDLSGQALSDAFDALNVELKLLINTGSSSGVLLEYFGQESEADSKTLLVTATKSGRERNATRFGRYFTEALEEDTADLDKNGLISVQEAFEYAERETAEFYSSEGLIATEHSVMQGEHANLFALASLTDRPDVEVSPVLAAMYEQRDGIDLEIERLRMRRIGMSADDYKSNFQTLLIRLSMLQGQIDDIESGAVSADEIELEGAISGNEALNTGEGAP